MDGLTKAIYGSTHNGEHVRVSVYAICMAEMHENSPFVGLGWVGGWVEGSKRNSSLLFVRDVTVKVI